MNSGKRIAAVALGSALTLASLAGCSSTTTSSSGGPAASGDAKNVKIVATTSVLGSLVSQIASCAGAESTTLMPAGTDPHDFTPSSAQVAELSKATMVVANGFNLEGKMVDVLENIKKDGAKVYEVAPTVDPIDMDDDEHGHEHEGETPSASATAKPSASASHDDHDHSASPSASGSAQPASPSAAESDEHGHDHGGKDPHFWLDGARAAKAAENIGRELKSKTGNDKFESCGTKLKDDINKVNDEVKQTLSSIPEDKRVMITDHDALGYFAKAYDFEIAGVVVPGGGTSGEPSSADIAKLVDVIKKEKVPAIFSNTAVNPKLEETIAKEAGQQVKVVPLFVDAIGDKNSGADTYQGMMRTDAKRIAEALR